MDTLASNLCAAKCIHIEFFPNVPAIARWKCSANISTLSQQKSPGSWRHVSSCLCHRIVKVFCQYFYTFTAKEPYFVGIFGKYVGVSCSRKPRIFFCCTYLQLPGVLLHEVHTIVFICCKYHLQWHKWDCMCTHKHMYIYIHVYTHVFVCTYIYIYLYTYMYVYMCIWI